MSVEFNDNQNGFKSVGARPLGGISKIIVSFGLAKDQAGANKVQLIIALVCFSLALYVAFF